MSDIKLHAYECPVFVKFGMFDQDNITQFFPKKKNLHNSMVALVKFAFINDYSV